MKMILMKDKYVEFDICDNGFKYGIVKDLKDDNIVINQLGEFYKSKHYVDNRIRVRDIIYDNVNNMMKIGV